MTDDSNTKDIDVDEADQPSYHVIRNREQPEPEVTMILTHTTTSTGEPTTTLELLGDLPGGATAYLERKLDPDQALKSLKELMDDQMDDAWTEVMARFLIKPES